MPDNRSAVLVSTAVIVVAALLRLWPSSCPPEAQASTPAVQSTDAKWGVVTNITIDHHADGDVIAATPAMGLHRLIKSIRVPAAGRYRLSVETAFAGASGLVIDIGDSDQPKYGLVSGNLQRGQVTKRAGDVVAAGVEPVPDKPGHYRWWVDMDYVPGQASYDLAFSADGAQEFAGNDACKIVLFSEPSFTPVSQ
jgi:hypothetical protein